MNSTDDTTDFFESALSAAFVAVMILLWAIVL
jgi:hypothetical protein